MTDRKPRLSDLDQCKGLAIFLVVLGHVGPSDTWIWAKAWGCANHTIYGFHMPFFMFLSGAVTLYTYRPVVTWGEYTAYVGRRFLRFFPPYVLFALLISISKYTLAANWHVDRPPVDLLQDWGRFVWSPLESSATSLWYIYVLVAYAAIMPVLLWLARNRIVLILPFALAAYFLPLPINFLLLQIAQYCFLFLLGGLAAQNYDQFTQSVDRWWRWCIPVFGVCCAAWWLIRPHSMVVKLVLGLLSVPVLVGAVRRYGQQSRWLELLGRYTFAIYLMNMLAMGGIKAVIFKFWSWDGARILVVGPMMLCGGLLLPILIKKHLLSRVGWLDKITT